MLGDINCLIKRKSLKVIPISLLSGLLITFLTIPLNSQEVTDTTIVAETAVAAAADDGISVDPDIIDAGRLRIFPIRVPRQKGSFCNSAFLSLIPEQCQPGITWQHKCFTTTGVISPGVIPPGHAS